MNGPKATETSRKRKWLCKWQSKHGRANHERGLCPLADLDWGSNSVGFEGGERGEGGVQIRVIQQHNNSLEISN